MAFFEGVSSLMTVHLCPYYPMLGDFTRRGSDFRPSCVELATGGLVYNVYNDHRGVLVKLPPERDIDGVRRLAESYATLGHPAFLRAFRLTSESVTGERFETAFSVLNGKVVEHRDVTIPKAHF